MNGLREQTVALCSAYLAPANYYKDLVCADRAMIEQHDHYEKQSYRNRCLIGACDQVMSLTIPVEHPAPKTSMKDVRISYANNWQIIHWRAIESAYNSSPFFEYYKDDLEPIFRKKWDFLIDFNMALLSETMSHLNIRTTIETTNEYHKELNDIVDHRERFHPKRDKEETQPPYYQVFDQKFGFRSNLSIIDLIFNMGPEAILYLNSHTEK